MKNHVLIQEESLTIDLLSIQIDKCQCSLFVCISQTRCSLQSLRGFYTQSKSGQHNLGISLISKYMKHKSTSQNIQQSIQPEFKFWEYKWILRQAPFAGLYEST